MHKVMWIAGSIIIIAIAVLLVTRKYYKDSPDYNFITAKLDIKNGKLQIVNTGFRKVSLKDKEIEEVTKKYGFKNIYIRYDTTPQIISGINNYNEVMEDYLMLRNGINWRKKYQWEVDSIYKSAPVQNK